MQKALDTLPGMTVAVFDQTPSNPTEAAVRAAAALIGLAAMGVQRAQFSHIIQGALADHCHKTNPRLASVQDYEAMLKASM